MSALTDKGLRVANSEEVVATKAWDHSLFRRLLKFAFPHKKLFFISFGVLLTLFCMELLGPWIWRNALDGPIENQDRSAFWGWIAFYALVLLSSLGLRYLEVAQLARTGQTVIHDLRTQVFRHMQRLDLAFFDKEPTGALVTRVTTDIEHLNEMFTSGVITLLFDLIKVAAVLAIMFAIHWKLALVVLALTPILIGISIAFRGGARRAHRLVRSKLAMLNGYLQEVLSGIRVVQVFRREQRVSHNFSGRLDDYFAANQRTIFLFALFYPSMSICVFLIQGVCLWVAAHEFLAASLSKGEFVQFWFYLNMVMSPIRELGERYNVLQSAFASAERVFQVLDTKAKVAPPEVARPARTSDKPPHIRFEGVHFSYLEGSPVLADVSFDIPPGTTTAIVGATGAGKSTLVNLLLRFYDPTRGRVSLDGIDIRELDPTVLRNHFGLVLQEDFLFAGTVRDNLVMDRPEVDDAILVEALAGSRADAMVERLSGGLDAEVAERGATFSTGERQLLAITRALAGRPDVVVLDEATASVDSQTEARIEEATTSLLEGRSALVVAHRLSTIRDADQILVMHRGELRERGTHEELLAQGGIYSKLHDMQFESHEGAVVSGTG